MGFAPRVRLLLQEWASGNGLQGVGFRGCAIGTASYLEAGGGGGGLTNYKAELQGEGFAPMT